MFRKARGRIVASSLWLEWIGAQRQHYNKNEPARQETGVLKVRI
jgi:hypothetical protein